MFTISIILQYYQS